LQITGPRFRDDMVLAFGEAWERANPWPAVAPGYEPFMI
jgi:Asp-tRNA(Asn)/Glu-tRNA(Gln) amidotransferase A subunit family amidase